MESVYIVEHPQFVSSLGVTNESLLAEDGLHLSFEGTEVTVQNIESAGSVPRFVQYYHQFSNE